MYVKPKTLDERQVAILKKDFPNIDTTIRLEDIDSAIIYIDSYLECRQYATDRDMYLKLKKKLDKLRRSKV